MDSGSYMCAIFNGSRRFLRRTTVIVLTPPVFTRLPRPHPGGVAEGAAVYLHCQARGTPVPEVKWYFNGEPVKQGHKVRLEKYSPANWIVPNLKF